MSPEELRELIANLAVDKRDSSAVSIAIGQYETALNVVLDELESPVSEDSSIVLMDRYRVCNDMAHALGVGR